MLSEVLGWQVRITGGAIFPTGAANAPRVKQLKNALTARRTNSCQQTSRSSTVESRLASYMFSWRTPYTKYDTNIPRKQMTKVTRLLLNFIMNKIND